MHSELVLTSPEIKKNTSSNLTDEDFNYISSVQAALLQQSPRGAQALMWVLCGAVIVFLLWAAFAQLDEFTRGEGKVVPSQDLQEIQNLEGGILSELFVQEGDEVTRGQVLLRIDDTGFSSTLRETSMRVMQLEIQAARLQAEAKGTNFAGGNFDKVFFAQENSVYRSRQLEFKGKREVFSHQIAQKEQELTELNAKINRLKVSAQYLAKEISLTEPLVKEGAVSEVDVLRLKRQMNDLSGELKSAQITLPSAKAALREAKEKFQNLELAFRREAYEQLNETINEAARLREKSEGLADRVERTDVRSPVAGTVKRLLLKTIGGVIQPGMSIVEVVPNEDILLLEVKVRPADIAYLHPQQKARIRFTAYDFSIMGGLDGELVHISPDSITDDSGESYYVVKVQTSDEFIGPDGLPLPIIPGMTASVDILTGNKTVLQYLLKPIFKTKEVALRER
ncbi:MAG: HlyD family type I secretion periplasmic adaptor subunit [Cellvibrionaceae bacterium]|nr:HlyD family type I secretion periplasmic adaptor subunit [Cellvibrionaceae bacterium]